MNWQSNSWLLATKGSFGHWNGAQVNTCNGMQQEAAHITQVSPLGGEEGPHNPPG